MSMPSLVTIVGTQVSHTNLGTVHPGNTRSRSEKYSPWPFNT